MHLPIDVPPLSVLPPAPVQIFSRRLRIGFGILGVLVLCVVTVLAFVYTRPLSDSVVHLLGTRLPLPAAVVDDEWISLKSFFAEQDALKTYFTSPGQEENVPTEEELTQNILDTLIRKTVVEQLAVQYQVTLDAARVEVFYQEMLGGTGEEAFAVQLQDSFGWTPDEFRARIVEPVVLATQVSEDILANPSQQQQAKEKIDAALARVEAGDAFATVATEVSGDLDATGGGDLGIVSLSDLPDEWIAALEGLEVGQVTGVIDGTEDYFVFQVTDRMVVEEEIKLGLSAIVVRKTTLEDAVDNYLNSVRVWRFVGRRPA